MTSSIQFGLVPFWRLLSGHSSTPNPMLPDPFPGPHLFVGVTTGMYFWSWKPKAEAQLGCEQAQAQSLQQGRLALRCKDATQVWFVSSQKKNWCRDVWHVQNHQQRRELLVFILPLSTSFNKDIGIIGRPQKQHPVGPVEGWPPILWGNRQDPMVLW